MAMSLEETLLAINEWRATKTDNDSYAALGLLTSIPLPTTASSSRSHRAQITLPPSGPGSEAVDVDHEMEVTSKMSYGRIVRDEQGNVIDIILDEEEDDLEETDAGKKDGGRRALNPEKDYEPEAVQAKTDVVRCKST